MWVDPNSRWYNVLAELAEPMAPAAFTGRRGIDHNPFARKMVGECRAIEALAREARNSCGLGDGFFSRKFILCGA